MSNPSRCLFVSGFLPSPKIPSGGQKLVYDELVRQARDKAITLLAFSNERESSYYDPADFCFCQEVHVVQLSRLRRLLAALLRPTLPLVVSARAQGASRWLRRQRAGVAFDEIWVEFIQGAFVLDYIDCKTTTVVVHDLFHQAFERRALAEQGYLRWLWRVEASRTRYWEARTLRRATRLVTLTEKDRSTIERLTGRSDVVVRYPQVSRIYESVCRRAEHIQEGSILFWGLMSRDENRDAVNWFCREVFPAILASVPMAIFIIAGADPGPDIQRLAGRSVRVLGFVDDPGKLFATVALAVAPLRLGSGIKIKVVEYLAARIPTVATTVGAEGVALSPWLRVEDDAERFAAACIECLAMGRTGSRSSRNEIC